MTSTSLYVYDQTIIGQLHTVRQLRAGVGMAEIVGDVGEVRALDTEPRRDGHRFVDAEVRRVRTPAQRVEDDRRHAVEERPRGVRNAVAVGQVREPPQTETEHWQDAVHE